MRKLGQRAVRDTSNGKFKYHGFTHPLCEFSYAKFMDKNRLLPDGSLRDADNWWEGWDTSISLDSMTRHVKELELIHIGLFVYHERTKDKEVTHVFSEKPKSVPKNWTRVTKETCCNAIRFNADAYKLRLFKENE